MANVTPMMQQYLNMKAKYKDCILFFRLGDFYEMFFDDAKLVSHELELTLTGKDCGLEERAPMCGIPYHAANTYVEKLIEKGYKVAICEQLEDPALAKGLVQRDVIRIITPGTVNDPAMLDERANNFLLSIYFTGEKAGLAFADVSTGEFFVHEVEHAEQTLADEVARIGPIEIITSDLVKLHACHLREEVSTSEESGSSFQYQNASEALCKHFALQDLSPLGHHHPADLSGHGNHAAGSKHPAQSGTDRKPAEPFQERLSPVADG